MGLERPAVRRGSGGLEPAGHRRVQREDGVSAVDHTEPQDVRRTSRRKGTDAAERQPEGRLSDLKAHALDNRGADGVGCLAGERQRQMHVLWANNLQIVSAITQRGHDRRLFGRDRGTCLVGQIDRSEQTHGEC